MLIPTVQFGVSLILDSSLKPPPVSRVFFSFTLICNIRFGSRVNSVLAPRVSPLLPILRRARYWPAGAGSFAAEQRLASSRALPHCAGGNTFAYTAALSRLVPCAPGLHFCAA